MMYITGDGTANISYSFVKQIPTNPFLFDLFGDEIRVMPDAYLDVDDDKRSPATYVLQFRYLFFTGVGAMSSVLMIIAQPAGVHYNRGVSRSESS